MAQNYHLVNAVWFEVPRALWALGMTAFCRKQKGAAAQGITVWKKIPRCAWNDGRFAGNKKARRRKVLPIGSRFLAALEMTGALPKTRGRGGARDYRLVQDSSLRSE